MSKKQERLVYINGEMFPESEAKISIFDAGLLVGDTVTEATRTFKHKPFRLKEHITRLYKSLKVVRIQLEIEPERMEETTLEVMKANLPFYKASDDLWLVHNITRGTYPLSGDPGGKRFPTVIIYTAPMDLTYWAEFYIRGCHAVTAMTRMSPQSLDPRIKNRSRMHYTLGELEVKLVDPRAQGIFLDVEGNLCENKGGNFFVISEGVLRTPRLKQALDGISRKTALELASQLHIPIEVCDLQPYDVYTADEAFFTSTPYCIMPATKFNGVPVGDGKVGPITKKLLQAWSELVGVDIVKQALDQLDPSEKEALLKES